MRQTLQNVAMLQKRVNLSRDLEVVNLHGKKNWSRHYCWITNNIRERALCVCACGHLFQMTTRMGIFLHRQTRPLVSDFYVLLIIWAISFIFGFLRVYLKKKWKQPFIPLFLLTSWCTRGSHNGIFTVIACIALYQFILLQAVPLPLQSWKRSPVSVKQIKLHWFS